MPKDLVLVSSAAARLLELDDRHPYRTVASGGYEPNDVPPRAWNQALPLALEILAEDVGSPAYRVDSASARRGALCRYLTWLADDDSDLLSTDIALSDDEIVRYLATAATLRRSSHRSRVALRSLLKSFRAAYPAVRFPGGPQLKAGAEPILAPVEDWQFDLAMEACTRFRDPRTRRHTRAVLLLARAVGADGADLRWITGDDITRRPAAGTWIHINHPTRGRHVPVLERYADAIEDLAEGRGPRTLIGDQDPPSASNAASTLTSLINRAMLLRRPKRVSVSPERLRKAWIAEQLGANVPLNTLLAAAGLSSLRTIETLVRDHSPASPARSEHLAFELGGIVRHDRSDAEPAALAPPMHAGTVPEMSTPRNQLSAVAQS